MEQKLIANDLYEMWDIAEEIVKEDIEREWKDSYFFDGEEESDFEQEYKNSYIRMSDYEIGCIVYYILPYFDCQTQELIDEMQRIVKKWWWDKPKRLDCNDFWRLCEMDFERDCFQLMEKHLKEQNFEF